MLLVESTIVAFISLIIGNLIFYFMCTKEEYKKKKKNLPKLNISLLLIGFFVHIILDQVSFNKIYCDKQCRAMLKNCKSLQ
jgi:hypothetical protein